MILYLLAGVGSAWLAATLLGRLVPSPKDHDPRTLLGPSASRLDPIELSGIYLNSRVSEGNRVELLVNGDRIFPPMLQALGEARVSVHLLTYIYWSGDVARRFGEALAAAARRGVEVRVLLDAHGARSIDQEVLSAMGNAGVEVRWFHPLTTFDLRRLNNRTHRKVMVVDGQVGFTGGVGIAAEWEGDAHSEAHWRDNHFRVEGPAVRTLQAAFAEEWLSTTGEVLAHDDVFPSLPAPGDSRVAAFFTSPRVRWSPVAFQYWSVINAAQSELEIASPYFLPDWEVKRALFEAVRRGVRVRVLLPGDHNDSRLVRWASLAEYPELLGAGLELFEYQPTMMHAKMMVADRRWSVVGSANMDHRSFALNDEVTLLVDDLTLGAALHDAFEADLLRAKPIGKSDFARLGPVRRLLGRLSLIVRDQL